MILPTTLIEEEDTLLRSGTYLLEILGEQMDITSLWKKTKEIQSIETFDRFTLGLVLLFCFGLVDMEENLMS
ncbi:ABC-three component system middle component 6, partial [Rickettsia tamurae]